MTHATKAIMCLMVADYLSLGSEGLEFGKEELEACLDRVELIDFHQTKEVRCVQKVNRTN